MLVADGTGLGGPVLEMLRAALENGELRIAGGVSETGVHDELALAVALAVWAAQRGKVGEIGERS